jgi:hypothetical protein
MAFKRSLLDDYPWQSRPANADGFRLAHDRWVGAIGLLFGNRCFSAEHLTLYRRHDSALTFGQVLPAVTALRNVRRGAKSVLVNETRIWSDLSAYFQGEAKEQSEHNADRFQKASHLCGRISKLYAKRTQIFTQTSRIQKVQFLLDLFLMGALKEFGPRNLVKDVIEAIS